MTTTEIRQRAAELIEERGWIQEDFEGPNGELCILGAIGVAVGAGPDFPDSRMQDYVPAAQTVAELEAQVDALDISNWNDELGRTKEEVLAALRGQP